MNKKIFISAGDPSGDIHAARLMIKLKEKYPNAEFFGIGGKYMIEQGLESFADIRDISVVGFWEVAKKYSFFRDLLNKCKNELIKRKADIFIPVDYPGFNIKIAEHAKQNNIPVIYYIAPQLWAWGKNRAKKLTDITDKLLVVFPFEEEYFRKYNIDAHYVGHPLLEDPVISQDMNSFSDRENIIALLPGSRKQEIQKHIDIFSEIAVEIKKQLPDYSFMLAKTGNVDDIYFKFKNNNVKIDFFENSKELMNKSKAGVVKTGTSNLEAALCGMPFAMVYKTSAFTYWMGRSLINLPWISIVNILQNETVVKEFIQHELKTKNVADYIADICNNNERFENIQKNFLEIKSMLGNKNASENASKIIYELLEQKS